LTRVCRRQLSTDGAALAKAVESWRRQTLVK